MKNILCLLSSLLVLVSCFDDSKIWDELNEHESRLTELEQTSAPARTIYEPKQ